MALTYRNIPKAISYEWLVLFLLAKASSFTTIALRMAKIAARLRCVAHKLCVPSSGNKTLITLATSDRSQVEDIRRKTFVLQLFFATMFVFRILLDDNFTKSKDAVSYFCLSFEKVSDILQRCFTFLLKLF